MTKLDEKALAAVRDFASKILHGDDVHKGWLTEAAECYISGQPLPPARAAAPSPAPVAVKVKPLDLSAILRDAFLSGRGVTGRLSDEDQAAWTAYDPGPLLAFQRITAALSQAADEAGGQT